MVAVTLVAVCRMSAGVVMSVALQTQPVGAVVANVKVTLHVPVVPDVISPKVGAPAMVAVQPAMPGALPLLTTLLSMTSALLVEAELVICTCPSAGYVMIERPTQEKLNVAPALIEPTANMLALVCTLPVESILNSEAPPFK